MDIIKNDLRKAIENRRTYYSISDKSPVTDDQIKEIIDFAVLHVPSAFNSQSTRIVLLLDKSHKKIMEYSKEYTKKDGSCH